MINLHFCSSNLLLQTIAHSFICHQFSHIHVCPNKIVGSNIFHPFLPLEVFTISIAALALLCHDIVLPEPFKDHHEYLLIGNILPNFHNTGMKSIFITPPQSRWNF